ncbi:TPA: undecaprenyl-phosphate glucose phosphotransferase, partial [Vibrio cholerae]
MMKEKSRIRITNYHGKFFYRLIDSIFILVIMYISIKSNQHVVTMSYISVALLGVLFY